MLKTNTILQNLNYRYLFIISLILYIPAYFINLGMLPFIDDEGIRALVALEMKLSGDFTTPTLSGELYFRKPPLYNWIISLFFQISGQTNEFWMRFPAVLSILFFTISIYHFVKKELNEKIAIISSLMFLTCGRIIIYESLHGLIDICYSWITYISFIQAYRLLKQNKHTQLFIVVYILSAAAYLMKGLPTVAFTGITLITLFAWQKNLRLLFSWKHFIGISIFLLIVGSYYITYFTKNQINPIDLFTTLFTESSKRTGFQFGLAKTILHLFTFPFEIIYHFLPWTIFAVFLIRRDFLTQLRKHDFIFFNAIIFLSNISIYWISVEVYARYLLMLIPLLFTIIAYFIDIQTTKQTRIRKLIINIILPSLIIFFILTLIATPFIFKQIYSLSLPLIKISALVILISLTLHIYLKRKDLAIPSFVIFMLILRIGFNWFVLPSRLQTSKKVPSRQAATELGLKNKNNKLCTYWNPNETEHPYYGKIISQYSFLFYVTASADQIIEQKTKIDPCNKYLVLNTHYNPCTFSSIDTIHPYGNQEAIIYAHPKK